MPGDSLDSRDVAALTSPMSVLESVDPTNGRLPPVRGAPGLYLVVSDSGREYVVDAFNQACTCDDHFYRDVVCKHIRRVEFATGRRDVPDWANDDVVDDYLGIHVRSRTDRETGVVR